MAAGKVKVIDLAKELGVTSKDLMVAAEEMGHKGVRAMTPVDSALANALRVKLGKGRDLPEEPKPKRESARNPSRPKRATAYLPRRVSLLARSARPRKTPATVAPAEDAPAEIRPAATIVKPRPLGPEPSPEPLVAARPEIALELPIFEPVAPAATASPVVRASPGTGIATSSSEETRTQGRAFPADRAPGSAAPAPRSTPADRAVLSTARHDRSAAAGGAASTSPATAPAARAGRGLRDTFASGGGSACRHRGPASRRRARRFP